MGAGRQRRAAWATGLSLVLHVLALTGMVVGLRIEGPPPEDRAVELQLIPPSKTTPRPQPAHRQPERGGPATFLGPHPTPTPPPEAPVLALPAAPAPGPQPEAGPGIGLRGLSPSLSGRLGCDSPLGRPLTSEQRQACYDNLARRTRQAPQLALNIPADKKAAYDRYACRHEYIRRPKVPSMNPAASQSEPAMPVVSNVNPYYGQDPGVNDDPGPCLASGK